MLLAQLEGPTEARPATGRRPKKFRRLGFAREECTLYRREKVRQATHARVCPAVSPAPPSCVQGLPDRAPPRLHFLLSFQRSRGRRKSSRCRSYVRRVPKAPSSGSG